MKKIINRRDFIKMSGLSVAGLTMGIGAGKFLTAKENNPFSLYGFLPNDEIVIRKVLKIIQRKTGNISYTLILSNEKSIKNLIENELKNNGSYSRFFSTSEVLFRIEKINNSINSDILLSDQQQIIYNPDKDFSNEILNFRKIINNKKADLFFRADVRNKINVSQNFNHVVKIENENGEFDRINLSQKENPNYNNISIPGPQGKIEIEINNNVVKVTKSACRHEICKKMFASNPGDVIACAPNKILIKIIEV